MTIPYPQCSVRLAKYRNKVDLDSINAENNLLSNLTTEYTIASPYMNVFCFVSEKSKYRLKFYYLTDFEK